MTTTRSDQPTDAANPAPAMDYGELARTIRSAVRFAEMKTSGFVTVSRGDLAAAVNAIEALTERNRELKEMGRAWHDSDEHKNANALRDELDKAEAEVARLTEAKDLAEALYADEKEVYALSVKRENELLERIERMDDIITKLGSVCAHGSLARQCRVCELEAVVAERDQRIAELEQTNAGLVEAHIQSERTLAADTVEAEARVERLQRKVADCETCGGSGVMSVIDHVEPPDGHEVYVDETCAHCRGTGQGYLGELEARAERLAGLLRRCKPSLSIGLDGPHERENWALLDDIDTALAETGGERGEA